MPDANFDPIAYINTPRFATWNFGLSRIEKLLEHLGNPQDSLQFVHVAGTNGKGSTCAYLASILHQAGYKTGLFTSPYIETFEERIRINGENIPLDSLREITLAVRCAAEQVEQEVGEHPTEFELMTAVALEYFCRQQCDIVVLEVGLGGRLDSTNVISTSVVSVITRIGLDHTQVLGDTLAEIAAEKAGIIKPHGVVVNYPQEPEAEEVILEVVAREQAQITEPDFAALWVGEIQVSKECGCLPEHACKEHRNPSQGTGENQKNASERTSAHANTGILVRPFTYQGHNYTTQLLGSYQPYNAALALEVIEQLRAQGWKISPAAVTQGVATTTWPGRFEVLNLGAGRALTNTAPDSQATSTRSDNVESSDVGSSYETSAQGTCLICRPAIVVDGGHNPQGAEALRTSLEEVFPGRRVIFIMGALADKDLATIIRTVAPLAKAFVTVEVNSPRAAFADDLAALITAQVSTPDTGVYEASSYEQAFDRALSLASVEDVICAFGSLYGVSEAKNAYKNLRQE